MRIANDLIKYYAISSPSDIRLEDIAMDRNVFVKEGDLKNSDAYLLRANNRGIVRVRNSIPELGRKRFAIAHELGHWEMHTDQSQLNFCTEDNLSDYQHSPMEIEANVFAAELLMPPQISRQILGTAPPSLELAKELAETFNTSLTASVLRLIELTKEDCLAIFSNNGIVKWWRKGKPFSNVPRIEKNHPLHVESEANEILCGKKLASRMVKVPTEAWFPWVSDKRGFEVYEQSMKLGSYPTILTLLWIIAE
nr:ImmA/IrrE family metallo-endopeptidase [uncultured Desulfuromonas sp.]